MVVAEGINGSGRDAWVLPAWADDQAFPPAAERLHWKKGVTADITQGSMTQHLDHIIQRLSRLAILPEREQERIARQVQEILDNADSKAAAEKALQESQKPQNVWDMAKLAFADIPEEEWRKLPADGAAEHDHYLYGSPKRNP